LGIVLGGEEYVTPSSSSHFLIWEDSKEQNNTKGSSFEISMRKVGEFGMETRTKLRTGDNSEFET